MSKRSEIVDGSLAESTDFNIVYTCYAGWVPAHFGHSAPKEAHAFSFRLRAKAPDGKKRFPISRVEVMPGGELA